MKSEGDRTLDGKLLDVHRSSLSIVHRPEVPAVGAAEAGVRPQAGDRRGAPVRRAPRLQEFTSAQGSYGSG